MEPFKQQPRLEAKQGNGSSPRALIRFLLYSSIGVFMFFVPMPINGTSSIMLDHIVTAMRQAFPAIVPYYALLVIFLGALYPFYKGTWRQTKTDLLLAVFKLAGLAITVMVLFGIGPQWMLAEDMGPFLFDRLVVAVGLLVPIGAVFLAMLTGYGLLELAGVWMQPIMRKGWNLPGRSAIDVVASFVGSYSLGLLITNRLFREGRYSVKEATIIATGFSTVSVTFMVVVANTLDLMANWNVYFWSCLVVTFTVTAVTARVWPLKQTTESYYNGMTGKPEAEQQGRRLQRGWAQAMAQAQGSLSLSANICANVRDGFRMTMNILPSIMSIGLFGLALAKYTPLFAWLGVLFFPVTALVQLPDPAFAASAAATSIAEMFLPAAIAADADLITRFTIGVVCVSSVLFFSAVIPTILATDIPVSVPKLLVIWFERVVLSILLAAPIAHLFL